MVDQFEEDFIRTFWNNICIMKNYKGDDERTGYIENDNKRMSDDLSNLMHDQTSEYYKIRDFVVPGLYYIQKILESRARNVIGLDSGSNSATSLKDYNSLIDEQNKYNPKYDKYPFQNGPMRRMQARDFSSNGDSDFEGNLEATRSSEAKSQLPFMALRGRADDVKKLVDCGVLKPEAREEIEKFGTQPLRAPPVSEQLSPG